MNLSGLYFTWGIFRQAHDKYQLTANINRIIAQECCIAVAVSFGKYEKVSIMVLKDLKKMSISAKTMSWTVAVVLAVAGDCCTGYMTQVNTSLHNTLKDNAAILVLAFKPSPFV